jgi:hypothetical protein
MIPQVSLREALSDPALLGHALPGDSWRTWRVMLMACMGEQLTEDELVTYTELTGRSSSPTEPIAEGTFAVGRRGGKSRALSVLTSYISTLCQHPKLAKGEKGVALLIAGDKDQATVDLDYSAAVLGESPVLKQMIASRVTDELSLTNGISILVRPPSFRRLRGRTCIFICADEIAFWLGEDRSSNPDTEVLAACKPMLLTTGGPLILASSVYAKKGCLYEAWKRDYGPDGDPRTIVALGTSMQFHPDLPQEVIDRELEKDREKAAAEYLSIWRSDLQSFVDRQTVEQCTDVGVKERPYVRQYGYHAFFDAAGGSGSDSAALAIAHRENERIIIDVLREARPPFSPADIVADWCQLLATYKVVSVRADAYAGSWVVDEFRRHGRHLLTSDQNKSQLYGGLLPLLNTGRISLLDHQRAISQICGLERRTRFGGRGDSIDHADNSSAHDDLSNVIAGAAVFADRGKTRPAGHRPTICETSAGRYVA